MRISPIPYENKTMLSQSENFLNQRPRKVAEHNYDVVVDQMHRMVHAGDITQDQANTLIAKAKEDMLKSFGHKYEFNSKGYIDKPGSVSVKAKYEKLTEKEFQRALKGKPVRGKNPVHYKTRDRQVTLDRKRPGGRYKGKIQMPSVLDDKTVSIIAAAEKGASELSSFEKALKPAEKHLVRIANLPLLKKAGLAMGIGAVVTTVRKATDREDTGIHQDASRFVKTSLATGAGIGLISNFKPMYQGLNKRAEVYDISSKLLENAPNNLAGHLSKIQNANKEIGTGKRLARNVGLLKNVGKASAGLIGAATLIDTATKAHDSFQVKHQTKKENKEWKKNQQKNAKVRRKNHDYGATNYGQLAIDLFNESIGHTKMGNSKYY